MENVSTRVMRYGTIVARHNPCFGNKNLATRMPHLSPQSVTQSLGSSGGISNGSHTLTTTTTKAVQSPRGKQKRRLKHRSPSRLAAASQQPPPFLYSLRCVLVLAAIWTVSYTWYGLRAHTPRASPMHDMPPDHPIHDATISIQSKTAAARIHFFDPSLEAKNCTLGATPDTSQVTYLGSGYNGQIFAVPRITCPDDLNHDGGTSNAVLTRPDIVLKLKIFPSNFSDKIKFRTGRVGTYRSEIDHDKHLSLYQRLVVGGASDKPNDASHTARTTTNAQRQRILQHFAVRIGTVDVPRHMVENAVQAANPHLTMSTSYKSMQYPIPGYPHDNNIKMYQDNKQNQASTQSNQLLSAPFQGSIRAQVYAHVKGRNLRTVLATETSLGVRQQIARDLIAMYRHLHRTSVLVCDMKLEHFLVSRSSTTTGNNGGSSSSNRTITTMIDFDDFRYSPAANGQSPPIQARNNPTTMTSTRLGQYAAQWQQWQLLVLLAHVCDYQSFTSTVVQQYGALLVPAGVASIACGAKGGNPALLPQAPTLFGPFLAQCQFAPLGEEQIEPLWQGGPETLQYTNEFYDRLADWSGVSQDDSWQ